MNFILITPKTSQAQSSFSSCTVLPIMGVTGRAASSASHFSNWYCPQSRDDWYVPSLPLLLSDWSRWDYSVCMKMVSLNINCDTAPCTLIIRMFFHYVLSPSLVPKMRVFLSDWYSRKVYQTSRLTSFSLIGPWVLRNNHIIMRNWPMFLSTSTNSC